MSDKQETIADIVAEMRGFKCRNLETGEIEECSFIANYLSDRIEAAHKREVEAITAKLEEAQHCWKVWRDRADELKNKCNEQYAKLKAVGNGAKMREALLKIVEVLEPIVRALPSATFEIAKKALAEPPRNCDRFCGDPKKLKDEWREWSGDPRNCNADGTVKLTYGEWLLANTKGGAE